MSTAQALPEMRKEAGPPGEPGGKQGLDPNPDS